MSGPKVLVIGCGVAGPVVAILLKLRGYDPIVFEKAHQLGDAGGSLFVQSNGWKVLNLVGVADELYASTVQCKRFEELTASGKLLGATDLPATFEERYGQFTAGLRRSLLSSVLVAKARSLGIEVRTGCALISIDEETAWENGSVTAHFVNGADGLKSVTRKAVLGIHGVKQPPPSYTGLVQILGISSVPVSMTHSTRRNWYGVGWHAIGYPTSKAEWVWALTLPEPSQADESWRTLQDDEIPAFIEEKVRFFRDEHADERLVEFAKNLKRVIKFGLCDREALEALHWHIRRCVLIGDAAHPTSPHLGQGANQALEDSYHLSQALPDLTGGAEATAIDFEDAFEAFAQKRQPRTSHLVKGARANGERRVKTNPKECAERDEALRIEWRDQETLLAGFDELFLHQPFW
ncbi:hypothetical protein F5Y16DRAFT_424761 [Xylariaceae sp. FL0255]|nr:hypothetical protein F5Y16DRAFT_424761 [Xylariaceae sp. FL0255]